MATFIIPLEPIPNQALTTRIGDDEYAIEVNTMREKLFITVRINGILTLLNRSLLTFAPVSENLMLIDQDGNNKASYDGLGGRFLLVWSDE